MLPFGAAVCAVSKQLCDTQFDHCGMIVCDEVGIPHVLEATFSGVKVSECRCYAAVTRRILTPGAAEIIRATNSACSIEASGGDLHATQGRAVFFHHCDSHDNAMQVPDPVARDMWKQANGLKRDALADDLVKPFVGMVVNASGTSSSPDDAPASPAAGKH